ncbi:MAG: hypothetical protein FJX57_04750 [Alphaproteobacteria bacterium]|nr:hypothetical protein [Alphaproteobacteria bacterium]
MLKPVIAAMGATTNPFQLQPLGQAGAALAPKLDPAQAIAALADVLRYPTIDEETERILLGALKSVAAEAPGTAAGLDANLAWIAARYPDIDLRKPPACPRSNNPEFSCPEVIQDDGPAVDPAEADWSRKIFSVLRGWFGSTRRP